MKTILSLALVVPLAIGAFPSIAMTVEAPPTHVSLTKNWCLKDAPGYFRRMRAEKLKGCSPSAHVGEKIPRELIVPLPCDRAMVFRRVDTPATSLLDQVTTDFGGVPGADDIRLRYAQSARFDTIAGGFTINGDGVLVRNAYDGLVYRSYYIAAYELTELQWSLFESGALEAFSQRTLPAGNAEKKICAATRTLAKRTPPPKVSAKIGLGYYDAVDFSRALNAYLIAENNRRIAENNRRAEVGQEFLSLVVPWERGSSGFARLPSEAEWEFAARGGSISEETALGQSYLVSAGDNIRMARIDEVANLPGMGQSGGKPLVGTRKPNLIGLYDVIGNAEEITQSLFRLVRPDSLHGTRGGVVMRGGDIVTPAEVIGISRRTELALYTPSGEARATYGGLRLVLVAPVFSDGWNDAKAYEPGFLNTEFEMALRQAHDQITSVKQTPGAQFRDQARDLIVDLKKRGTNSDDAAQRFLALEDAFRASEAAINVAEVEKAKATTTSAVATIQNIRLNGRLVYTMLDEEQKVRASLACIVDKSKVQKRRQAIDALAREIGRIEDQIAYQTRYALRLIGELTEGNREEIDEVVERVRESFTRDKLSVFDKAWEYFALALDELRESPSTDLTARFSAVFDDVRERREILKSRSGKVIDCAKKPG